MEKTEFTAKIKQFKDRNRYSDHEECMEKYTEFLKLFPFKEQPETIDKLTVQQIYNPGGDKNYFFNYLEHKLRGLGALSVGSARVWENARDNLGTLKELLKIAVDDSISLADKIDSHWEKIKGFGGDRHIAKKIIYCYYPELIVPAYKTDDLEDFSDIFSLDHGKLAYEKYKMDYSLLSVGQKFELFNDLLIELKNSYAELKNWDNVMFMWFLYTEFPVSRQINRITNKPSARNKIKPFSPLGLIAEPKYEQEVVFLFSKYHMKLGFPMIVRIAPAFPDAEVIDENRKHKKIEFEVTSNDFINHGHNPKECDYIICWEDNLTDDQKKRKELPQVIALKDELGEI